MPAIKISAKDISSIELKCTKAQRDSFYKRLDKIMAETPRPAINVVYCDQGSAVGVVFQAVDGNEESHFARFMRKGSSKVSDATRIRSDAEYITQNLANTIDLISEFAGNHTLKSGDVLSQMHGGEDTQYSFYQVVNVRGQKVTVRRIRADIRYREDDGMYGTATPMLDQFVDDSTITGKGFGNNDVDLGSFFKAHHMVPSNVDGQLVYEAKECTFYG